MSAALFLLAPAHFTNAWRQANDPRELAFVEQVLTN
jgi:hypothetical protein